jgi:membrane protein implicated in regulation of membrane protease activity
MRPLPLQFGPLPPETLPLVLVVAGLGLSLAEALAPGAHFVVLGVALLLAGVVGLVLGPLASPFVLAALVVVFGALALYGYRELDLYGGKGRGQTSDSASLTGRTGRVTERVTPTSGAVKLDSGGFNPNYAARSVDGEIEEDEEVIVVDPGGGNVLTVESLSGGIDDIDRELARERARRRQREAEDAAGDTEDTETDRDVA